MTQPRVELRILGHTELRTAGGLTGGIVLRQPKRLALLAYLALATADGFRRRDQIVGLFWPKQDQLHARTQLRKALYAMRGVIGTEAIIARGEEEVRLDTDRVWCDAVAFRGYVEAGEWQAAVALYRGHLLEGLFPGGVGQEFEEWLHEQRASLRETAARAAWESSSRAELAGNRGEAIALGRQALELVPDDEDGIRRLIAALDRHGDRAGALRLFNEWRARLKAEFGTEPAPETRKLVRRVQAHRQGESMETPHGPPPAVVSPLPQVAKAPPVASTAPAVPSRASSPRRAAVMTLWVAVLAIVAGGSTVFWRSAGSAAPVADLAVLPFRAFGDSAAAIVGEGIAEELTTALAQQAGITVRSLARSREVLNGPSDLADAGQSLAVRHVIDGSIRRDERRLRVTMRLVRVSDAITVWARTFDISATDVIASQEALATTAVAEVVTRLARTR